MVLATEVGGRWSEETQVFLRQLAKAKARAEPVPLKLELPGCTGGALFWHVAAQRHSGCLCWNSEVDLDATVPLPPRRRSWGNCVTPGLLCEAAGVLTVFHFLCHLRKKVRELESKRVREGVKSNRVREKRE